MNHKVLNAAELEKWISAAVAAPSLHNSQPWTFRLDTDTTSLEVRAAPERGLRAVDATGRALHLSVGAAVFNLRVAVAHSGWLPLTRLLPDPDDPGLLARVRIAPAVVRATPGHRPDLFDVIWRRHSSRFPFSDRPVPADVRAELAEAAHANGAVLTFPGPAERAVALRLTAEAEQRNRKDAVRGAESRRWVRRDGCQDTVGAGMPRAVLGPQDARDVVPMRDFTARRHRDTLPAQDFERTPAIAVLTTSHDRRADWLRAGQALEHVLLVATAHQVRSSLLHQAMEWPDLRRKLSASPDHLGHAHMVVRLGYGPEGPATPRRPWGDVYAE
ncbi:hypothetical protein [Streptomyces sp. NPDC052225]|uniref:Acg family FMN-binding oxidoreductase n=1 Tax=Streptomyces sp. NPDC052225 TaxID=3154949 RepID=UPI003443D217